MTATASNTSFDEHFAPITYEYLGIDPLSFYQGKFIAGDPTSDLLGQPSCLFDIEYSRVRFLTRNILPGTVLDLGCGSGPWGNTVRKHCNVTRLVGVDMDSRCVEIARRTYDQALTFCLTDRLPFDDNTFDAVFSVDFFGHVEFRHKDSLIREILRVTRPGGVSVHVIESGPLDYGAIAPANPKDPMLRYVRQEGHVGVEPAGRLRARWERFFQVVSLENALVYPLYPVASYLADNSLNRQLRALIERFNLQERVASQVCLGYVCDYFQELARKMCPEVLTPADRPDVPPALSGGANLSYADRCQRLVEQVFRKPCGLVYLVCQKPDRDQPVTRDAGLSPGR